MVCLTQLKFLIATKIVTSRSFGSSVRVRGLRVDLELAPDTFLVEVDVVADGGHRRLLVFAFFALLGEYGFALLRHSRLAESLSRLSSFVHGGEKRERKQRRFETTRLLLESKRREERDRSEQHRRSKRKFCSSLALLKKNFLHRLSLLSSPFSRAAPSISASNFSLSVKRPSNHSL